jgi:dTMP kinase
MTAFYVVFEGIDGCGKTTQSKRLFNRFCGCKKHTVLRTEPSNGPVGTEIRRRLTDGPPFEPFEALGMFVGDRRNALRALEHELRSADVVIQDRSYFSTAVYQGSKPTCPDWSLIVDFHRSFMPEPDLIFLLDIPVSEAMTRIGTRGIGRTSLEDAGALEEGRRRYTRFLGLTVPAEKLCIVDAAGPADLLEESIWNVTIRRLMDKTAPKPVTR